MHLHPLYSHVLSVCHLQHPPHPLLQMKRLTESSHIHPLALKSLTTSVMFRFHRNVLEMPNPALPTYLHPVQRGNSTLSHPTLLPLHNRRFAYTLRHHQRTVPNLREWHAGLTRNWKLLNNNWFQNNNPLLTVIRSMMLPISRNHRRYPFVGPHLGSHLCEILPEERSIYPTLLH